MKATHAMGKYHAIPTIVDGIRFDSKREAVRYCELKLLEKAGEISDLQCHRPYPIVVNRVKVATYESDFFCLDNRSGEWIVEDVKAPPTRTPVYRLKKKLVKAIYGIDIVEV